MISIQERIENATIYRVTKADLSKPVTKPKTKAQLRRKAKRAKARAKLPENVFESVNLKAVGGQGIVAVKRSKTVTGRQKRPIVIRDKTRIDLVAKVGKEKVILGVRSTYPAAILERVMAEEKAGSEKTKTPKIYRKRSRSESKFEIPVYRVKVNEWDHLKGEKLERAGAEIEARCKRA